MKKYIAGLMFFAASSAYAAPPEIEALNSLPNAAQLYLDYCLIGHHACVTVKAICYGQCGSQGTADAMGYGCSGDIEGFVPPGFHYAGWSAESYDGQRVSHGQATPGYDHAECHNPRWGLN